MKSKTHDFDHENIEHLVNYAQLYMIQVKSNINRIVKYSYNLYV
jgi:hypothetical protein